MNETLAPPSLPSIMRAGVVGIDPEVVVVAVRRRDLGEGRAAVGRLPHLQVGDVDRVGVDRVGDDVGVVPGPVHQVAVGRHLAPRARRSRRSGRGRPCRLRPRSAPRRGPARRRDDDADLAQHAGRASRACRRCPSRCRRRRCERNRPLSGPPLEMFQKLR